MLRGRTRVLNACQRCRKQKIKCSGSHPCRTCSSRGFRCNFGAEDKQVLISEKELFDLRNRERLERNSYEPQHHTTSASVIRDQSSTQNLNNTNVVQTDLTSSDRESTTPDTGNVSYEAFSYPQASAVTDGLAYLDVANPLVPQRPAYISETSGKLRYLGHSSTYAFTQQVLHMLCQSPSSNPSPEVLLSSDGSVYKAESNRLVPLVCPDVSGLPSKGVALHYLQCVRFRTNPLFYLFDDANFNSRLQQFYQEPQTYAQSALVWYIHYLLLMALGKAMDPSGQMAVSSNPTVSQHFTKALQSLPDMTYLCDDPVEATELFCCIALYLQSIDHRQAAVIYIGQAVRMAHLYALHLDLDESIVGIDAVKRGRRVWWTVYALNQKLISNIGLPNIINDQDITSPLPVVSETDEDGTAVAIHVKICRLLGILIGKVYSSSEEYQKSFASTAQTVLKGAAGIADELKQYSKRCFGEISRVAAHLELGYHHCIILTCRPALFYLLKLRSANWLDSHPAQIPSSLTGLIQVCVDSAMQATNILSQLKKHNLLDTFLPFDLECGFSAALVLVMAAQLHPRIISQDDSVQTIKDTFSTISAWGNVQANLRRLEIEQLDELLRHQTQASREIRNAALTRNLESEVVNTHFGDDDISQLASPFFSEWTFDAGLSSHQIMNLAEALHPSDFSSFGP